MQSKSGKPSRKIQHEYRDSDGYWIELAPGWILAGEWTHGIVEDTKKRAHSQMALVEPCECIECKALLAKTD
jgi:hypothetical protein